LRGVIVFHAAHRKIHMPTPNYSFEKRRKELERKSRKEEKKRRKLEGSQTSADEPSGQTDSPASSSAPN
jgi:hypothetical protein